MGEWVSVYGEGEKGRGGGGEGGREGGKDEEHTFRKSVLVPTRMKGTPGAWCFISGYLREGGREGGRKD